METSHVYICIYYISVQALVTITYLFSFIFSNILFMYLFIDEVLILLWDISRKKTLNYMIGIKYGYEVLLCVSILIFCIPIVRDTHRFFLSILKNN